MSTPTDFNAQIIEEFRANGGRVGGMFEGRTLLLRHHTGARSGATLVNPLVYIRDGSRSVISRRRSCAPTNPGWYDNLLAHPDTTIDVGSETIAVTASEATGAERERLFDAQVRAMPRFGDYAQKTERVIPVVVLMPR